MKFVVDMNLSPALCLVLKTEGWDVVHWSDVGDPRATDTELMIWAAQQGRIVLTHDLDLGSLLAATQAEEPSVVQVRIQDVLPDRLAPLLIPVLKQYEAELNVGALIIVDPSKSRVRILPLM